MTMQSAGWLSISTEGFAAMNAARPAEHLIKELVQNAFDSFVEGQPGRIELRYGSQTEGFVVECADNGSGISNLGDLRVVYLTHKTDSHLKRGRFGRGFKEALCIAEQARVTSGDQQLEFLLENGERVTRQGVVSDMGTGTRVWMRMPWPAETRDRLDAYFAQFLVPEGIELVVNGERISARAVEHRVEANITTELYDAIGQSWKKPSRTTAIHLVRTQPGETATIYEMGIPVAAVDWNMPYHCDVQQRVPMNPNRDAVASGYPVMLHVACLPRLLEVMDESAVKDDWVGTAGRRCESNVQKRIIEQRAFGENIARSVPRMGERHFDEDARELGVQVVNTAQASGGFRDMLRVFVPSAQEVVKRDEIAKAERAGSDGFSIATAKEAGDLRQHWLERQGGADRVGRCLEFAVWFCQQLVDTCPGRENRVSGQLTLNHQVGVTLYAHWSVTNVLTLALDQPCFWQEPMGPEALQTLIHEAAHALNMHHGLEFRQEVERLAGVAASLMLLRGPEIRERFSDLLDGEHHRDGFGAGLRRLANLSTIKS
ncbi:MAG: ATP-binding protein [Cyanobacteria bacterium]|nr:ATP-binding protein [Cyanobacteriota bacterium]